MGYSKGTSGNPAGRPKGSQNKNTRAVREMLREIVEGELSTLRKRLAAMPEAERVAVVLKLLPYVLPRLESTSEQKEKVEEQFSFLDGVL